MLEYSPVPANAAGKMCAKKHQFTAPCSSLSILPFRFCPARPEADVVGLNLAKEALHPVGNVFEVQLSNEKMHGGGD